MRMMLSSTVVRVDDMAYRPFQRRLQGSEYNPFNLKSPDTFHFAQGHSVLALGVKRGCRAWQAVDTNYDGHVESVVQLRRPRTPPSSFIGANQTNQTSPE